MPRNAVALNRLILGINFCVLFERSQNSFLHVIIGGHVYDESKYDMSNKTIQETLDKKYRYPMHVAVVKCSCFVCLSAIFDILM